MFNDMFYQYIILITKKDIYRLFILYAGGRRKSENRDLPIHPRFSDDEGPVSIDTQTSPSLGFAGASAFETYCRSVASDETMSEASIATESAHSAHEDSINTPTTPISGSTSNHTDLGQSD